MAEVRARAEREMNIPPEAVYGHILEYRERANWLPPNYTEYTVDDTQGEPLLRYRLQAGRRERDYALRPSAGPGHTLEERDTGSSLVHRWTVSPRDGGTLVVLETTWQGAGGVGGIFERLFAPRAVTALHEETLARLERYTQERG